MPGEQRSSTLAALVLPSLVPAPPNDASEWQHRVAGIAQTLQKTGGLSDVASAAVFVHLGPDWVDRVAEVLGRVGSAGEQLGLALATVRDASRWTEPHLGPQDPRYATMAVRAQAEMTAMWTLSAAHGLANALMRLLWLNPSARAIIDTALPKAQGFPPFSEDQGAWVSFEPSAMKVARSAAAAAASPAALSIANSLSNLLGDNRWAQFRELRNVGFHRWRPQSVDGGTPKHSPVEISDSVQSIRIGTGPTNAAPDMDAVLKIAEDGLILFSDVAAAFDERLVAGLNETTGRALFRQA